MSDTEHDAVANSDPITGNEARIEALQLLLDGGEEWSPLGLHELLVLRLLGGSARHREMNPGRGRQKFTPRVHNPVNFARLLPVSRVVVAVLHAQPAQNRTRLLHLQAFVVDDGQRSKLARLARAFAQEPRGEADGRLDPLHVGVVEQGADGLGAPVAPLEVLDSHRVRVDRLPLASVSHCDMNICRQRER